LKDEETIAAEALAELAAAQAELARVAAENASLPVSSSDPLVQESLRRDD
jgi:hypothetical protein